MVIMLLLGYYVSFRVLLIKMSRIERSGSTWVFIYMSPYRQEFDPGSGRCLAARLKHASCKHDI